MKILIAGLPGSGKTTQAVKLAKELNLDLIRTGDILREMAEEETELGQKVKAVLESGKLVDDILVSEIVKKRVEEDFEKDKGFVMDGYPRTIKQVSRFDPMFDIVFYLQISEDEIRRRLLERGRMDDAPEVVSKRLVAQEENMFDILFFYKHSFSTNKQHCEVHEIDAEKDMATVHDEIRSFLGNG